MKQAKRFMAILLAAAVMLGVCGCGKPKGLSDNNYEAAKRAIKIVDLYFDGIDSIHNTCDKLELIKLEDADVNMISLDVKSKLTFLLITAYGVSGGIDGDSDLKEKRDELADLINYKH